MLAEVTDSRNPHVGMLAIVRKRRAVISEVKPFSGDRGILHLVRLDYKDEHRPESEEVLWELEPARRLMEPNALPSSADSPMPVEDFDALLRAARWGAILPYLDPDSAGPLHRMPVSAPFHGAVQVEDYQMVPLLKALAMPRINLLIADDVGVGKTIEAGLILSELLIRRRIQRVLILTPASLRLQWQRDELWDKFSLAFDVIDRDSTLKLKRSLGIDANPWRSCSRVISSYYYLRQHDVLEQFRSACRTPEGSPHLPWDLLIVDEVHNLMPSPFGEDSELCNLPRPFSPSSAPSEP
ncbi:MAG TPA: SNF2-related protein [Pirellulaceae bacterium]|nr:SNF2-related protein [Pirellulaceae bacterium]